MRSPPGRGVRAREIATMFDSAARSPLDRSRGERGSHRSVYRVAHVAARRSPRTAEAAACAELAGRQSGRADGLLHTNAYSRVFPLALADEARLRRCRSLCG